jgi:hypothetical protein
MHQRRMHLHGEWGMELRSLLCSNNITLTLQNSHTKQSAVSQLPKLQHTNSLCMGTEYSPVLCCIQHVCVDSRHNDPRNRNQL